MNTWLEDNILNKYINRQTKGPQPNIEKLKRAGLIVSIEPTDVNRGDRVLAFKNDQWFGIIRVEGIRRVSVDTYEIYGFNEDGPGRSFYCTAALKIINRQLTANRIKDYYCK